MENKQFYSSVELAKILGISRIAIFKQIKKGKIRRTAKIILGN